MGRYSMENSNPQGRIVGDCSVRALAKATGKTWDKIFSETAAEGYRQKDMQDANAVWGAVLKNNGFTRHAIPESCPECYTVEDFAREHPAGAFVLCLQGHVVACVDGRFYDTWDSGRETVIYYFDKEKR